MDSIQRRDARDPLLCAILSVKPTTRHLPLRSATIDKLKGDNDQLKEELQVERKHAKLYDSVSAQAQIAKLQDTGDMYTRKIELEKRRIEVRCCKATKCHSCCRAVAGNPTNLAHPSVVHATTAAFLRCTACPEPFPSPSPLHSQSPAGARSSNGDYAQEDLGAEAKDGGDQCISRE